jgi:NSS family neurotransmitter:Na+ symporter
MNSRGSFASKTGFIAAAAGSAVGLGNIWKFPFEVGNGGGAAFVLIYLACVFIFCFPLMITVFAMGRHTKQNIVSVYDALGHPGWNFLGKAGIITNMIVFSFYNVVAGWTLGYFVESFAGSFLIFDELRMDIVKMLIYGGIIMFITILVVVKGISEGIERVSKILMPTLVVILIILVAYSSFLPHSGIGLSYYLIPDFGKVNFTVVGSAIGQAFFSLALGAGIMMTYGSYVSDKDNLVSSATLIMVADVGIAFLSGLVIFPFVAFLSNGTMEGVDAGSGLIFQTLPGAFESLGSLGIAVGSLFFLLLTLAALTTTVAIIEVPISYLTEKKNISRKKGLILTGVIIYLAGIPSILSNGYSEFFSLFISYFNTDQSVDFMTFLNNIVDTWLPLAGLLIAIFVTFFWGRENLHDEISKGNTKYKGSFIYHIIHHMIGSIIPLVLGFLFLNGMLSQYFGISLY